MSKVLL